MQHVVAQKAAVDHRRPFPLRIDLIPAEPVDVPRQVRTERCHHLGCHRVAFLDQLMQIRVITEVV